MTESQLDTHAEQIAAINGALKRLNLSAAFTFVPVSQSRNAKDKWKPPKSESAMGNPMRWQPTLNWRVTILRGTRELFTTDYSAGCAHAPSYKQSKFPPRTLYDERKDSTEGVSYECETGRTRVPGQTIRGLINPPTLADLFYSLCTDSDVIDHPDYESWASDFDYDPDSRKGEATYRACLDIALKLRAAIGDSELQKLRELFQDY